MPYDTQDMSLTTLVINGITQGFTVNGQAFVFFGELFVPCLSGCHRFAFCGTI